MKHFILIFSMIAMALGINASSYKLRKVWEITDLPSFMITNDVRQGFGMGGKFYINDKSVQTTYIYGEEGLEGTLPGGANCGITRDEAGNILVSTATFPDVWGTEAGIKVINPETGESVEYLVPDGCGLLGRCDFIGFAKGNFFEDGVLYLTGGNTGFDPYTDGVAVFTVTGGEVNHDKCYLATVDGGITGQISTVINYYKDLNGEDALLYAYRSDAPSKLLADGDIFTKTGITLPNKGAHNGCFPFVWDGKELFVYSTLPNYWDGWAIAEAGAEVPLVGLEPTVAANPNGFQCNWLNAEVDELGVTIYQFVPRHAIRVWRLSKNYDFVVDGICYGFYRENEVIITGIVGGSFINIPKSVTYNGVSYRVTSIDDGAFEGHHLELLVLPVGINTSLGSFLNCSIESLYITGYGEWQGSGINASIGTLYIGSSVSGIQGIQIKANEIYSYASMPPMCDESTFTDYGGTLHVPATSFAAYFVAPYWCNFGNIVGDAVEPTGIALNEDIADLLVNGQLNLTATVTPANATPHTVTWSTSASSVATVDNGLVTAVGEGECDIIASCLDKRAVCHITASEIEVISIILNQENAILEVNEQLSLTATVTPDNASFSTVAWSTTNSDVATVDDNGTVRAVGTGECDIVAACGGLQTVCHVVVVPQKIYITLDKHSANVLPNHMVTLIPSMTPISTELQAASSNPTIAAARIVNGVAQVVGISEGTVTITVGSVDGYAIADTCQVTVYTEIGDVNCDGFVNISDVTDLIDYLLSDNGDNVSQTNADCDKDGVVNIADVTTLIDYLLGGVDLNPSMTVTFTVNGV